MFPRICGIFVSLCVLGGSLLARPVCAQSIAVANASFENPALGVNGFTNNTVPGWTVSEATIASAVGVFRPGPTVYPSPLPDGVNVAYIQYNGALSQRLAAPLTLGSTYVLSFGVGRRADTLRNQFQAEFGTVGNGGTLVPLVNTTVFTPATAGTFETFNLNYTVGASDPIGADVYILFRRTDQVGNAQVNLDNIRLTAVPGPGALAVGLIGSVPGVFALLRRRSQGRVQEARA